MLQFLASVTIAHTCTCTDEQSNSLHAFSLLCLIFLHYHHLHFLIKALYHIGKFCKVLT